MSFEEAFELPYFGASVLHPNTMFPVIEKEIPVQIINSKNIKSLGTLIDVVSTASDVPVVKSIAYKKGVTVLTVSPDKRLGQYLFWESIFSILSQHGIGSGLMTTSEYSIAFAIDSKSDITRLEHELSNHGRVRFVSRKGEPLPCRGSAPGSRRVERQGLPGALEHEHYDGLVWRLRTEHFNCHRRGTGRAGCKPLNSQSFFSGRWPPRYLMSPQTRSRKGPPRSRPATGPWLPGSPPDLHSA